MTILVPKDIDLLQTTAVDYDYPEWVAGGTYNIDDKRVYLRAIYQRLTSSTAIGGIWNGTTIYTQGYVATYNSANYTFTQPSLVLAGPATDTTHYTDQGNYASIDEFDEYASYAIGNITWDEVYGIRRYYYCIQAHIPHDVFGPNYDWTEYWYQIPYFQNTVFYKSTDPYPYVHSGEHLYLVSTDVVADTPDIDTYNWVATSASTPDIDTDNWSYVGPANTMRMFDSYSTTQTIGNAGPIANVFRAVDIDGIYLGNILADTVTINIYDAETSELIETYTESLQYEAENWLEYMTGMWITRLKRSLVYWRTTLTSDVIVSVTIDYGETPAACGVLLPGSAKDIGVSVWGLRRGGMDYTGITQNADGSTTANPGLNVPLIDIECVCDTSVTERIAHDLDQLKGKTIVAIGDESDKYPFANIFGTLKKYSIHGENSSKSTVSLEFNGLAG